MKTSGINRSATFFKSIPQKYGAIIETTKALKLPKGTVKRTVERVKLKSM